MRLKILKSLRERPMNANRLCQELGVDYKTVRHHLKVLEENGLVERIGQGYGAVYVVSEALLKNWDLLEEVESFGP
ncbi:MAG: winged helix-turn-helix domain-containing protein [Thermoproteus sp.]